MKLNKSVLNFAWLFISSVAIKGLGVLRESIIAYMIGNTAEFATFNILRALVDFFLAFVIGVPVIESILVPKYAGQYLQNSALSFQPLWKQTLSLSKWLFCISVAVLFIISYIKTEEYNLDSTIWILLFSGYLAVNLSNSVLFSLQKAIGNFQKYSTQSFLNAIFTLVIIFLLIKPLGLKAIIIASILGIIFSNIFLKNGLRNNFSVSQNTDKPIRLKDINFYRLISVNHAVFIGFTGRLFISFENSFKINYYQYSFIIISSFMLMIVSNIASVILYKSSTSDISSLNKTIILTFLIASTANTILYFFGDQLISLLYQRGHFTAIDTTNVFEFLKSFLVPYTFFAVTQVMIQPFLRSNASSDKIFSQVIRKTGEIIFFCTGLSLLIGFSFSDYELAVKTLLYSTSIGILLYLTLSLKKLKQPIFNKHTI